VNSLQGSVLRKQATPYFLTENRLTLTVVQRMMRGAVEVEPGQTGEIHLYGTGQVFCPIGC
jgi:hypothetical protein